MRISHATSLQDEASSAEPDSEEEEDNSAHDSEDTVLTAKSAEKESIGRLRILNFSIWGGVLAFLIGILAATFLHTSLAPITVWFIAMAFAVIIEAAVAMPILRFFDQLRRPR